MRAHPQIALCLQPFEVDLHGAFFQAGALAQPRHRGITGAGLIGVIGQGQQHQALGGPERRALKHGRHKGDTHSKTPSRIDRALAGDQGNGFGPAAGDPAAEGGRSGFRARQGPPRDRAAPVPARSGTTEGREGEDTETPPKPNGPGAAAKQRVGRPVSGGK